MRLKPPTRATALLAVAVLFISIISQVQLARATSILANNTDSSPSDSAQMSTGPIYQCFKVIQQGIVTDATMQLEVKPNGGASWTIDYIIYSTTGTYGSTCAPNSALAISSAIDVAPRANQGFFDQNLVFSGANQILLTTGTAYALGMVYVSGSGFNVFMGIGTDNYPGNTGNCQPTCTQGAQDTQFTVNGNVASLTTTTQCYGSCGTLQNTNTTHTVLFNQTFTLFYMIQSQQSGFVNNVTLTIAKQPASFVYLGLYQTPQGCNVQPFTANCQGSLVTSQSFNAPLKGTITLTTNLQVQSGQTLGIAFSSQFDHFDANDTNSFTNTFNSNFALCTSGCETWQTAGIMPTSISNPIAFSSTIKASLQARITGVPVVTPSVTPTVAPTCPNLDCIFTSFVNSGCSVVTTSCTTGSALLLILILTFLTLAAMMYFSVQVGFQPSRVNVGEFGVLAFIMWVFVLTSFNLLPFWVPVLFFMIFAGLFSGVVKTKGGGGFI